jgi:hypothetical protein
MGEYKKLYIYENELDLWENLIRVHLVLKRIKLSEQAIKVFIYFCAYGMNKKTFDLIIQNKVVMDKQVLYNCRTFLRAKGLISMIKQSSWVINEPFDTMDIVNELNLYVRCKIKE